MNSNFWNYIDLSTPVFVSSPLICSNPHAAVTKLKLAMVNIKNTLHDLHQLHLEAAALSRLVYKTKYKLRQEKSFKTLQMINRCLTNYLSMHLPITLNTIQGTLEDDKGPSRQMLQWFLIRIFSVAHLFHRIYSLCTLAAGHLYVRMKIAQMYEITFFAIAVVSRIWTLAQFIVQKSCEWYSSLYPFLDKLLPSVQPWLPEGTTLPSELEGTLGYPSYLHLKSMSKPEELISQLDLSVSETDKAQINGNLTSLFDFDDIGETVARTSPKENSVKDLELFSRVSPKEYPVIDLEAESTVSHKRNSVIDLEVEEHSLSENKLTNSKIIVKPQKFQDADCHLSRKNQMSTKTSLLPKEQNLKLTKTKENLNKSTKTSGTTYNHSIKSIRSSKDLLKFLEVESALRNSSSNTGVTQKSFMKNCDKLQWSMMEKFIKKQAKLLSKSEESGDLKLQEKLLKRVQKSIKSLLLIKYPLHLVYSMQVGSNVNIQIKACELWRNQLFVCHFYKCQILVVLLCYYNNQMETIFHEKQEGSLCAQHCLNALLQGSYFTAVELAALAQEMDEAERLRMAESGVDSEDYKRFLEQPSGNMDDSGYFSVQVINSALELWGLEMIPYNSTEPRAVEAQNNPAEQKAYICNYRDHWFTIRRLANQWFNLNSLLTGPELISNTYLAMFLAQLQQEGYSIFVVCGELPPCTADEVLLLRPAVQAQKPKLLSEVAKSKPSSQDSDDSELQKAIRMSLGQDEVVDLVEGSPEDDEEEQIRQAMLLSLQTQTPTRLPEVDPVELRQRRLAYLESSGTKVNT